LPELRSVPRLLGAKRCESRFVWYRELVLVESFIGALKVVLEVPPWKCRCFNLPKYQAFWGQLIGSVFLPRDEP